jgi:hypothetical protein
MVVGMSLITLRTLGRVGFTAYNPECKQLLPETLEFKTVEEILNLAP